MRLRDGSINLDDYNIWQTRDVAGSRNCDLDTIGSAGRLLTDVRIEFRRRGGGLSIVVRCAV